tara:strand:+ start:1327 stop:2511 length:1185 start_codon:yes stop_codon:yes gene_type:complete
MNIIVFEDQNIKDLAPFSINHSSFELKCGIYSNLDRIINSFNADHNYYLIVRDEIKDLVQEKFPRYVVNPKKIPQGLYLNGAAIWNKVNISKIKNGYAFSTSGNLVSFLSDKSVNYNDINDMIVKTSKVTSDIDIDYISYLWDCIDLLDKYLKSDKEFLLKNKPINLDKNVITINLQDIHLSNTCTIEPGCVLDATNGPIILKEEVLIESGAIIKGPVFIDQGSIINNGTKLKGKILIGPYCKVGGEVTSSIFYAYSNKQHDGFLGNSFIGEWVNLGANTNNSNLKNNYSKIKFNFSDRVIDTKKTFLGVMIGDFSRTGISTMINTGSYIGLGANIFGEGFQKKYIKSFNWGQNEFVEFNKFIETIKIMKKRRSKELSDFEVLFLKKLYDNYIK